MIDFLRILVSTEDKKILFILSLICIAMVIDFSIGLVNALVNKNVKFQSKIGINGILRKVASLVLLIFFIPISILFPNNIGNITLYVLYCGYLLSEFFSILENLETMGVNTTLFKKIITKLQNFLKEEEEK